MGPLAGIKIIEMAGLGPAPFCGMLLADLGAQVISVQRASTDDNSSVEFLERGKQSIALNLKSEAGLSICKQLIADADVLIEGFRPGVMERLGLSPEVCMQLNSKLIFARMTGWGQTGPLSQAAGHDINYIALTGALFAMGKKDEKPPVPLNLIGDYGGGALYLALGITSALLETARSGKGQVIDVSMVEGAASMTTLFHSLASRGSWNKTERESNFLDGTLPFYNSYQTKDDQFVSIASIEPQFFSQLVDLLDLEKIDKNIRDKQFDPEFWPELEVTLTDIFKQKTRDEWCDILQGSDVCFAPVLNFDEAIHHPHNVERQSYIEIDGHMQPAPTPRFSRTQLAKPHAPKAQGADTVSLLKGLGYSDESIDELKQQGVLT